MAPLTYSQELFGDVSICYSGGLDSTSVAYMSAAKRKGTVHLHTFRHGYGYLFYFWAARTARKVAKQFPPGAVVHRYVHTRDLFNAIAMRSLAADHRRYGQWFGCCLGCTMAVVTKMLIYNLERGIPHLMFCSSVGGQYAVMSTPGTIALQKEFCGQYGVIYSTPLIDDHIVKARERELLDSVGVFRGIRFLDKHSFGNQGYCLLSLQHLPDVLFDAHPSYPQEQVKRFFLDKRPLCERYIADYFKRTHQDLEARIGAIKRLTLLRQEALPPATGGSIIRRQAAMEDKNGILGFGGFRKDSTCVAKATSAKQVAPRFSAGSFTGSRAETGA